MISERECIVVPEGRRERERRGSEAISVESPSCRVVE